MGAPTPKANSYHPHAGLAVAAGPQEVRVEAEGVVALGQDTTLEAAQRGQERWVFER